MSLARDLFHVLRLRALIVHKPRRELVVRGYLTAAAAATATSSLPPSRITVRPRTAASTTAAVHSSSPPSSRSTATTSSTTSAKMSTQSPLAPGLWKPNQLQALHYGPSGTVTQHLRSCLPTPQSKAYIITGRSLAQTNLIDQVVVALGGPEHHAGTFSSIRQHAPVKELDEATELVFGKRDEGVDTLISVGGGSPIDSAKAISYRMNEKHGRFLFHITIPTTLSAAECTFLAGYTNEQGQKTGVADPRVAPHVVIYDAGFGKVTPKELWLSTGLRALDHSVEMMYHPTATEMPGKSMAVEGFRGLMEWLPRYAKGPEGEEEEAVTRLFLAAFASLGFMGGNLKGGLGLSHALGYALGSPYGIPHGITSCFTLGHVVKLKAENHEDAVQIARLLPLIQGAKGSGDVKKDALEVGERILKLVDGLGLKKSLKKDYGVGEDQVEVIAKTATKQDSGPVFEKVKTLVEGLY